MKSLVFYIPFLLIALNFGFKNPESIDPVSATQKHPTAASLKNGFYWVANRYTSDSNVKMNLAKLNKSYLVNDEIFITQKQIKSLEVKTIFRNGKSRDILTITFDTSAGESLAKFKPDFANPLNIALVLNNNLIFVAAFYPPFKGNIFDFSSINYSKADLIEIKRVFDELIIKDK